MTAEPQWSPVDHDTADLLDLLADDGGLSAEYQWAEFVACLRHCAKYDGGGYVIRPNMLRPLVRGVVKPSRIGAFTRRAVLEGLVEYTGEWQVSDDTESGNAGKPCRVLRWVGGAA